MVERPDTARTCRQRFAAVAAPDAGYSFISNEYTLLAGDGGVGARGGIKRGWGAKREGKLCHFPGIFFLLERPSSRIVSSAMLPVSESWLPRRWGGGTRTWHGSANSLNPRAPEHICTCADVRRAPVSPVCERGHCQVRRKGRWRLAQQQHLPYVPTSSDSLNGRGRCLCLS